MNVQTKIDTTEGKAAYESDFALWAMAQAHLLSEGRFAELDIANLVDEVDGLGRSQRAELRNRLVLLIEHLLKHRHGRNPNPRNAWRRTIREQRRMIALTLRDNPSLRPMLETFFLEAWPGGVYEALKGFEDFEPDRIETYEQELPEKPDFTAENALRDDFFPERDNA